jgi:hypothetical protein
MCVTIAIYANLFAVHSTSVASIDGKTEESVTISIDGEAATA